MYKVIVPYLRKNKLVSYPASGCQLYTREQAIDVLKKFYQRSPWNDGDKQEPWAEGDSERFTLHYPELLV